MDRISFLPVDHAPEPPVQRLPVNGFIQNVARQLGHGNAMLTHSGRAAMAAVFRQCRLGRADEVFIATTFDYPNVSSCVTCTIFNFCRPSRVLTRHTRVIFVIHEFGVPHPQTPSLQAEARQRGIPLVEDCAHTIDSVAADGWRVGTLGDWVIVSLPKIFPVVLGGLLVGPSIPCDPNDTDEREVAVEGCRAAAWYPEWSTHASRRREVFRGLTARFADLGLNPVFEVEDRITPWFFPVSMRGYGGVRRAVSQAGIDCGVWHGSDVLVFPCHQFLEDRHLDRVAAAVWHTIGAGLRSNSDAR